MITKEDIYSKLITKRKEKIDDFDTKVLTSILLKKFFEDKQYSFFFTPKIEKKDKKIEKTPDYLIKKEGLNDIIGEIKQSLPNPEKDHFNAFLDKTIKQLKDYLGDLVNISDKHDVFIASNQRCNLAMGKLIEKFEQDPVFKDKIIILKYLWNAGTSYRSLILQKTYGKFTDSIIENELNNGKDYMMGETDLDKTQGGYKIFYTEEEFSAPIEYVMTVLWFNVFPELANSSSKDSIIERIKQGSNTLNFNLDEIWNVLKKYYVLPSFPNKNLEQFNKKMLSNCMDAFLSMKKAKIIDAKDPRNPIYSITFTKFKTKQELIIHFIEELNREKFKKQAEIEYNKLTNKALS